MEHTEQDRISGKVHAKAVPRTYVAGIRADGYSTQGLISTMLSLAKTRPASVATYVNVHVHNLARRVRPLRDFMEAADICYVDGAGIGLGAFLRGMKLPARTTAADFFPKLLQEIVARELRVFFLAGKPGVAAIAGEKLGEDVPGFRPVGVLDGYFQDNEAVIEQINRAAPDILIVGMGSPRQEMWIQQNRDRLQVGLIWSVGALLDFAASAESRCPRWMGDNGLEWLYRLIVRPRARARRYLLGNPAFLLSILEDWFGSLAVGSEHSAQENQHAEVPPSHMSPSSLRSADTPVAGKAACQSPQN